MSNLTNHALASQPHATHSQVDGALQRGTFRAVLADPPWCSQQTGRHRAAQHYRLMPLSRLRATGEAVREITTPRSFCFVWVTTATVPQGIELLEVWGFCYTSFYFRAKPRFSMGHASRNAGELLLLGVRGQGIRTAFRTQPNWGFHPLREHSHKPEEIHQIVERLVGAGPFVELLARRAAPSRQHWDIWGDECASTISLARWGYRVSGDRQWPQTALTPADDEAATDAMDAAGEEGTS